jgi:hypothetical protein
MSDKLTDNPIKPSLMETVSTIFNRVVNAASTVTAPSVDTGAKLDAVNLADRGSTVDTIRNSTANKMKELGI